MGDVLKVFFRGLLGVCATVMVVALVWTVYVQREALASALLPAGGLVDRIRGVSDAPDSDAATAPPVLAPAPPPGSVGGDEAPVTPAAGSGG
jgi:hypothetical protein